MSEKTKHWDNMLASERDAWIAEHMFDSPKPKLSEKPETGSNFIWHGSMMWYWDCDNGEWATRSYSTDANLDYKVLKKVRETWGEDQLHNFFEYLENKIWYDKADTCLRGLSESHLSNRDSVLYTSYGLHYEPGDYSHTAWLTLNNGK